MTPDDPSEIEIGSVRLPRVDWKATPASVQALVATLSNTIAQQQEQLVRLNERVAHLEEQVRQTSQNSSRPPSSDGFAPAKQSKRQPGKRRRGGQPGHQGHSRDLYPIAACTEVIEHYPAACQACGEPLSGEDRSP